jgi:hypothetical protein
MVVGVGGFVSFHRLQGLSPVDRIGGICPVDRICRIVRLPLRSGVLPVCRLVAIGGVDLVSDVLANKEGRSTGASLTGGSLRQLRGGVSRLIARHGERQDRGHVHGEHDEGRRQHDERGARSVIVEKHELQHPGDH